MVRIQLKSYDKDRRIYFIATGEDVMRQFKAEKYYDYLLIAINTINDKSKLKYVNKLLDCGKKVLIDSGVFNLATEYANKNNIGLPAALATDPAKYDGYQELFDKYCATIKKLEKRIWGYIEIDIGGQQNKIRIREQLHQLGFKPMPVYHPYIDEYDYFDQLAANYDRICVGGIAQINNNIRSNVIYDISRRKENYPNLWVHYLGVSMNPLCLSFQIDSCDSSQCSSAVRWNHIGINSCLKKTMEVEKKLHKITNENDDSNHNKAYKMMAFNLLSDLHNWRNYADESNYTGSHSQDRGTLQCER